MLLRVPLAGKLAGANALIAAAAVAVSAAGGLPTTRPQLVARMLVAVGMAFGLNIGLVLIALHPLGVIQAVAERARRGELGSRVPPSRVADPQLALLGDTLNMMLESLDTEHDRIRRLASLTIAVSDRERARLGRELHDTTAQHIAALFFQLAALARDAEAHAASPAGDHAEQRADSRRLAERALASKDAAAQVLEDVRVLAQSLHPRVLEDLGLPAALRDLAKQVTERAGIPVDVDTGDVRDVSFARASTLYRVAQEALANAVRHASPSRIQVRLCSSETSASVEITDDGTGFDAPTADGIGIGLFTMRERLALFDGRMELFSAPGAGTRIVARLPVSQPEPSEAV